MATESQKLSSGLQKALNVSFESFYTSACVNTTFTNLDLCSMKKSECLFVKVSYQKKISEWILRLGYYSGTRITMLETTFVLPQIKIKKHLQLVSLLSSTLTFCHVQT